MEPFIKVKGIAAPMPAANIDTDVIMPKQFLKGIDRKGLDRGLFYDLRFQSNGDPDPSFILHKSPWTAASFMVVGPNFGCGSSREHAVWGLKQMGIRALIGTSFAGIFFDNCQRNGVLLIELPEADLHYLGETISEASNAEIEVDLYCQTITLADGDRIDFRIDAMRRNSLLKGLDAIDTTLQRGEAIRQFEIAHFNRNPWLA
tara:strand:+ start:51719 stop:52327 length:609 start_codon:yes stop_codon:yes gene_type:complete